MLAVKSSIFNSKTSFENPFFSVATFQHRSELNGTIEIKEKDCIEETYTPLQMDILDGPGRPKREQELMELCKEITKNNLETFKLCMMGLTKN